MSGIFLTCWVALSALLVSDRAESLRELLLWGTYIGMWIGLILVVWWVWVVIISRSQLTYRVRKAALFALPGTCLFLSLGLIVLIGSESRNGFLTNGVLITLTGPVLLVVNSLLLAVAVIGRKSAFVSHGNAKEFLTELKLWLEVKLPEALQVPVPAQDRLLRVMRLEIERWSLGEAGKAWDLYDLDRGFRWTYPPPGGADEADLSVLPFDPAQGLGQAEIILVVGPTHSRKTTMIRSVLRRIMDRNVQRLQEFTEGKLEGEAGEQVGGIVARGLSGPIVHCDIIESIPRTAGADDLLGVIRASVQRLTEREVHGSILVIVNGLSMPGQAPRTARGGWWSPADIRRLLGHLILDGDLAKSAPTIVFEVDMEPSRRVFDEVSHLLRSHADSFRALSKNVEEIHRVMVETNPETAGRFPRSEVTDFTQNPTWILRLFTTEVRRERVSQSRA